MPNVQEHVYLNQIQKKPSLSHRTYGDDLTRDIHDRLAHWSGIQPQRNHHPVMGTPYTKKAILTALNHQGFLVTLLPSQSYLITCNPHNDHLHAHYQDTPICLVPPALYLHYLCHQHPDGPVEGLLHLILFFADEYGATDIHICQYTTVIIKKNQHHQLTLSPHSDTVKQLIYAIKLNGHLDPSQTFMPQDGAMMFSYQDITLDIRISTLPTQKSEMISLRLINPKHHLHTLPALGFSKEKTREIQQMVQQDHGLILITGTTGSGKSTTLYALLRYLSHRHVITLEDPIEQSIPHAHQTEINPQTGYTLTVGLKAILRHNPDVIAIGEIRDSVTAEVVMNAAYSGHLVIASVHTNAIDTTLLRLENLGCSPFLISYCLRGIINQSLTTTPNGTLALVSQVLSCPTPYIITDIRHQLTDFINYNTLLE
jgi:Tfp pilus assembly pilus retraction ATPase PilT